MELEEKEFEEELMEPEVITTTGAVAYEEEPPTKLKKHGTISLRNKKIAEMAARSYPVSVIAQELGMKELTIYRLLGSNEENWDEINTIIANLFAEGDRMLANLRTKALIKLDEQLESTDPDLRDATLEAWRLKWEGLADVGDNHPL